MSNPNFKITVSNLPVQEIVDFKTLKPGTVFQSERSGARYMRVIDGAVRFADANCPSSRAFAFYPDEDLEIETSEIYDAELVLTRRDD